MENKKKTNEQTNRERNRRTTVYDAIVTQIVIFLLGTYLFNTSLRYNISVPIRTIQRGVPPGNQD